MKKAFLFSLILHLLLAFALIDLGFTGRDRPVSEVYEVAIVAAPPRAGIKSSAPKRSTGKKTFVRRSSQKTTTGLADIKKEKSSVKSQTPELKDVELDEVPVEDLLGDEQDYRYADEFDEGTDEVVDVGTAPSGVYRPDATPTDIWAGKVKLLVQGKWKFPPELSVLDDSIAVMYDCKIARDGRLLECNLVLSSGNGPYDRSVKLAIDSIKNVPPPPSSVMAGQDVVTIPFNFTPPKGAHK